MVAIKLKSIVDSMLTYIRKDYETKLIKEKTWLYETFYPISTPNFNALEEIIAILSRGSRDPRKLETRFLFDPSRAAMPTVHIHMPSETPFGGNLVGMGFGGAETNSQSGSSGMYMKMYSSNYDIIVTSNNQTETILIYELIKRMFIGGIDTINTKFQKVNFSGKELLYDTTLMPDVFFRAFSIEIVDMLTVPTLLIKDSEVADIVFDSGLMYEGNPPIEEDEENGEESEEEGDD